MSENRNPWANLGGIVLGVGAAAATGFLLYELLKEDETPQRHTAQVSGIVRAIESSTFSLRSENCPLCQRCIDTDEFELGCGHKFHRMCLLPNYILRKINTSSFCCPVENCEMPLTKSTIDDLSKNM